MTIIETKDLTKRFGAIIAVRELNIKVEAGQVFGILGPNGSGKSTTLGMLAGVTNVTSGEFSWFGEAPTVEQRKRVGIILERPNFYPYMSAMANLKVVAAIKGIKGEQRLEEVLKTVGLYERRNDRFVTYSLGMKQRLSIGSALLNDPEVLVLDEPTNGLDPQGIAEIRELIGHIASLGKTILLASHLLDEVQKVCTHFMVMSKGKLMHYGPVAEVSGAQIKVELGGTDLSRLQAVLTSIPWVGNIVKEKGYLVADLNGENDAYTLNGELVKQGIVLSHLVQRQFNLEEKFLQILSDHE